MARAVAQPLPPPLLRATTLIASYFLTSSGVLSILIIALFVGTSWLLPFIAFDWGLSMFLPPHIDENNVEIAEMVPARRMSDMMRMFMLTSVGPGPLSAAIAGQLEPDPRHGKLSCAVGARCPCRPCHETGERHASHARVATELLWQRRPRVCSTWAGHRSRPVLVPFQLNPETVQSMHASCGYRLVGVALVCSWARDLGAEHSWPPARVRGLQARRVQR